MEMEMDTSDVLLLRLTRAPLSHGHRHPRPGLAHLTYRGLIPRRRRHTHHNR